MNSAAGPDLSVVTGLEDGRAFIRVQTRTREYCFFQKVQTGSGAQLGNYSMSVGVLSRGKIGLGVRLSIHLHLETKLRMSGAISLLSLYAFMAGIR